MSKRLLPEKGTTEAQQLIAEYPVCSRSRLQELADEYGFKDVASFETCMVKRLGATRGRIRNIRGLAVHSVTADLREHDFIYLIPLADLHIGSPQCSLEAIQGYIDWIKRRHNAYTLLNGDILNCATKESTPELYEDLVTPDQALEQAEKVLKPIKDRILGISAGGHELSIFHLTGTDYMWHLARNLGIENRYMRDGGLIHITLKPLKPRDKTIFTILFTHGWGGARTRGAKVKKVEDLTRNIEADIYVLSHDHTQNLARDNYLVSKPDGTLEIRRKLLVSTGGFLTYGGYVFRKGLLPQDLGTPRIRIDKKLDQDGTIRKDIHSSL